MTGLRILFSNLGYARGIGGSARDHLLYAHRHFYCPPAIQRRSLRQLAALMAHHDPDICCFVEIDNGSVNAAGFNQLSSFNGTAYTHHIIDNKYAATSRLRGFALTRGKSNAFIAKQPVPHEKLYFTTGVKRLIYKLTPMPGLTIFFAHFSLKRPTRKIQLAEARACMDATPGESLFIGDFNILTGLGELAPFLHDDRYRLLNHPEIPTFRFHKWQLLLDLCLATPGIARQCDLAILPQPYSDHHALMLNINPSA